MQHHQTKVIRPRVKRDRPLVLGDSGVNPANPDEIKHAVAKREAGEKVGLFETLKEARDLNELFLLQIYISSK
jgi:hypothetical protein